MLNGDIKMTKVKVAVKTLTDLNLLLMDIIMDDKIDKLGTLQWIRREAGDYARELNSLQHLDLVLGFYSIVNRAETLIDKVIGRKMTISHYYPETKKEYDLWMDDVEKFDNHIRKIYHHVISAGVTIETGAEYK
jgi:hypothetical protein